MKRIKLILVLLGMLAFSNVKAQQQAVMHITEVTTQVDGVVEQTIPADFWVTIGRRDVDFPHIDYKIILLNSIATEVEMSEGGTVSVWEAILLDDEKKKLTVQFGIMKYEDGSYLVVDFLDGTQIFYGTDKIY